jgi:predicted phosphodiesterase
MRIAVISDVHGNLLALDAVLADVRERAVDVVVNLGDLLSGGLQPRETCDRLMELEALTVRGNHERQVLSTPDAELGLSDRLARKSITDRHRAWLASLPLTLDIAEGVIAFHGSPTDDLRYLLETVDPDGLREATDDEVRERLGPAVGYRLVLCGHTHLARVRQLPGGPLLVNPGSVGWPAYEDDAPFPHAVEAGSPHARYAVVDDAGGKWEAELLTVTYDWDAAAAIARHNGRPDVAHAVTTGRV